METSKDVYLRHRIIDVTSLKIMEFFGYKRLEDITVRRQDDQMYRFREGDFKRLRRQDIEDMLLLLVQEMDLFSVVHLSKPKLVTEGVRPLRDGEEPLLESTAGRTMELVLEQPEVERAESEAGEVDSGLKRKRATSDDDAGTSKRVRHVSLGGSTSTEEETPDAPPTAKLAAKRRLTETPSPQPSVQRMKNSAGEEHSLQMPGLRQSPSRSFAQKQQPVAAGMSFAREWEELLENRRRS
ncbi:hypothetical protein Tco_0117955 [Tanacetum coccineum]